MVEVVESILF